MMDWVRHNIEMKAPDTAVAAAVKRLLIVDDEPAVIRSINRSLRREGLEILTASNGVDALKLIKAHDVGVVLSDHMMPGMDGITLLSAVRDHDQNIARILLTGHASIEGAIDAIKRSQIFEYLTKPWVPEDLISTVHRAFDFNHLTKENQRLQLVTHNQNRELLKLNNTLEKRVSERTYELVKALRDGILMLSLAAEARDDNTGEHLQRIKTLTIATCLKLGMSEKESEVIGLFSMMHDVGKIHIPDHILNKKSSLSEDEWHIMQTHTVAGERILGDSHYYTEARRIARSHHERIDGSGYPDGLSGNNIPLSARIVAAADVYDALTSERPYKEAWPEDKALEELKHIAGRHLDAEVVRALVEALPELGSKKLEYAN